MKDNGVGLLQRCKELQRTDVSPGVQNELERLHDYLNELSLGTVHDKQRDWVYARIEQIYSHVFPKPLIFKKDSGVSFDEIQG